MKLTHWNFHNIFMPMLEDDEGNLFCTPRQLCRALGITETTLRSIYKRHGDELDGICVAKCNAIEFLKAHRNTFDIKYLRDNMRLCSEDDMIIIAMLSRSHVSKEFRRELKKLIKENATHGYVTKEQYEELEQRTERLEKLFEVASSAAGTSLNAAKQARLLN